MGFLPDQSGELIGLIQRMNSPGFIQMYGGQTAPGGWVFCDGSLLDQAVFPQLFSVISTDFNTGGEPAGFFRVPDFRSRSPIGVGQGTGLSNYGIGQTGGEENHVLTIGELAEHTHTQNAHTHTQDAHNHGVTDAGHTHVQDAHTHTQNSHNHTQDAHGHGVTDPGHVHAMSNVANTANLTGATNSIRSTGVLDTGSSTTGLTVNNATATNQVATATNNNETAVNQSATTGVTVNNATATNQNTTATNNLTGSDDGHNTLHPYLAINFMIKLDV